MANEIENLWTPAHQAVENGDLDNLALLLDSGSNPDEECCGMTLLEHAIDYEADTAIQSGDEMGVSLIAMLLAYGASPRVSGSKGKGPLELAAEYNHFMAQRLIQRHL
ncbi:ankyrin repeat domain-containing protein [Streptomyces justiciae]|uniref:Ankyrin repeat domain-containing protein n=1 Tax=Streptomyces justiciae TaxID=2780140 RepID=A0ABU3M8B9_9ACTN|nr:ankyrin repeat domain-containing protein [Streptomyces justiciae]MDT7847771.1 ankyrin repeat domain-containing protein [Streptomyces justiciae]